MSFEPSSYQTAIFDFVEAGRGDGAVNAVAGSGKSTTLEHAARRVRSNNALFLAFNKSIAEELSRRLENTTMQARTIHSLGMSTIRRELGNKIKLSEDKYKFLARKWVEHQFPLSRQNKGNGDRIRTLNDLAKWARLSLISPSDTEGLLQIADHHDLLEEALEVVGGVEPIMKQGLDDADEQGYIDFTDMIYLTHVWDLQPAPMDWVFVDEAQDLSPLSLNLILRCRAHGGRMMFVGDPKQAIYGFAGADAGSFDNIMRQTSASEMPLSICYRCPTSHIALAKELVPQIEAAPGAIEGVVGHISRRELYSKVCEGDMILGRKNSTLIAYCFDLISKRIPARIKGRDIGSGIVNIIHKLMEYPGFTYAKLPQFLEHYTQQQTIKLQNQKRAQTKIMRLLERCASVTACYQGFYKTCTSADQLCNEIQTLFSDTRASVWLSTVHKAKGLESDRIFIAAPQDIPLVWTGQLDWELEQEYHLKYVALTRAKRELYFIDKAV